MFLGENMDKSNINQLIVGIGLIIVENRVLLLKRRVSLVPEYNNMWELPGGKIEIGESFESGIEREIIEETGLVVKCGCILPFSFSKHLTVGKNKCYINVICGICRSISTNISKDDNRYDLRWFNIDELDFNHLMSGSKEFLIWGLKDSIHFNSIPSTAGLYEIKMESIKQSENKYREYMIRVSFCPENEYRFVVERYYGRIGNVRSKKKDEFYRMDQALEYVQKIIQKRKSHGYAVTFINDNHPLLSWIEDADMEHKQEKQLKLF
jgi:8-oxo-dGTP diphosphatase